MSGRTARRRVLPIALRDGGRSCAAHADLLAREEPLGIRVDGTALTLAMRTPADDIELAAGFLVSEAVIHSPADIAAMTACDGTKCGHAGHDGLGNVIDVALAAVTAVLADVRPGRARRPRVCGAAAARRADDARRL